MYPPPPKDEPAARLLCPLPPSTNELFTTRRGSRQRIKTDKYRSWLSEAGWRITMQRPPMEPIKRCAVLIEAPVGHTRDLDNLEKPSLDLLKLQHCIVDDRWIDDLRIVRITGDAKDMTISIWPIA